MLTDRKMAIRPKEIFRFNTVLSQFKIHMKIQGIHNSQTILRKKKSGELTFSNFET